MGTLKNYLVHYAQVCDHKILILLSISRFSLRLMVRALFHDLSKFKTDEASGFSKSSRKYRKVPYAGSSYKDSLSRVGGSLLLHYLRSPHHPQHYPKGLKGMSLLDLVEMFYDWDASCKTQSEGSLSESIQKNKDRFGYDEELMGILMNERDRIRKKS